jgi:predicted nucleic acid-binding protein
MWLATLLNEDADLCICGLILTEILQGISSDTQYRTVSRSLSHLIYLPMPREVYLLGADIYRTARKTGKTIRNTVDCIIAACAIVHDTALLQRDKDFLAIASISDLKLFSM